MTMQPVPLTWLFAYAAKKGGVEGKAVLDAIMTWENRDKEREQRIAAVAKENQDEGASAPGNAGPAQGGADAHE